MVAGVDAAPQTGLAVAGMRLGMIRLLDFGIVPRWRELRPRAEQASRTLRDKPDDPQSLLTIGRWYALFGQWDMAADLLSRAREQGAAVTPTELAQIEWHAERFEAGAADFHQAIEQAKEPGERNYLQLCITAVERKERLKKMPEPE